MSTFTRAATVAAAALALGAPMLSLAPSASAASRDGVCDSGEFCYYYNSDNAGSVSDFAASEDDYGTTQPSCYEFKGAGNGQGQCIKNNAASVWNRTGKSVTVFYNSGYAGTSQTFAAGAKTNLNATMKNENASHMIGSSTSGDTCSTSGLGDPRTCGEAVSWAKSHVGSNVFAEGQCDHVAALAYGFSSSGSASASVHWSQVPSAYKHAGDRTVPAGGLAFFTGGSQGYGHVMISIGSGQFISTDIGSTGSYNPGDYNKTTITGLENAFGTVHYVGWAQPWFQVNH